VRRPLSGRGLRRRKLGRRLGELVLHPVDLVLFGGRTRSGEEKKARGVFGDPILRGRGVRRGEKEDFLKNVWEKCLTIAHKIVLHPMK